MESTKNGKITYAMLQRLLEKAWDERDMHRVASLSQAIDAASAQILAGDGANCRRVV